MNEQNVVNFVAIKVQTAIHLHQQKVCNKIGNKEILRYFDPSNTSTQC